MDHGRDDSRLLHARVSHGRRRLHGSLLLLVDRHTPGINVRKMETQFDSSHSTTFIIFEDVKVPAKNLIGDENMGFMYIMTNFNHERFVIAASTARVARVCYVEAFNHAMQRETFGKKLISHQVIRAKLAEMVRQIEALQDNIEKIAYQFSSRRSSARRPVRTAQGPSV